MYRPVAAMTGQVGVLRDEPNAVQHSCVLADRIREEFH